MGNDGSERGLGKGQCREQIDRKRRGSGDGMDDELNVVGEEGSRVKIWTIQNN